MVGSSDSSMVYVLLCVWERGREEPFPLKAAMSGFSSFILSHIITDHSLISFLRWEDSYYNPPTGGWPWPCEVIAAASGARYDIGEPNPIVQTLGILLVGHFPGNETRLIHTRPCMGHEHSQVWLHQTLGLTEMVVWVAVMVAKMSREKPRVDTYLLTRATQEG